MSEPEASRPRRRRSLPAVLSGLLIDLVDLTLSGPLGVGGAIVAGVLVWWITGLDGASRSTRILLALAAAAYAAAPMTELVPLGTAVGGAISIADWWRERRA